MFFPARSGICTFSSPTMTSSPWRTGSSTRKPTRCLSSARAACRMKRHRKRASPNKTEQQQTAETVKDTCTHTVTQISQTPIQCRFGVFSGAALRTLNSFPVKDVVVLRCDCKSFCQGYFLLALLFCGQSRQNMTFMRRAPFFLSFFPL